MQSSCSQFSILLLFILPILHAKVINHNTKQKAKAANKNCGVMHTMLMTVMTLIIVIWGCWQQLMSAERIQEAECLQWQDQPPAAVDNRKEKTQGVKHRSVLSMNMIYAVCVAKSSHCFVQGHDKTACVLAIDEPTLCYGELNYVNTYMLWWGSCVVTVSHSNYAA